MIEPLQAVRGAVAALNRGDVDQYLGAFSPDAQRWVIGLDDPLSLGDVSSMLRGLWGAFEPVELREEGLFGDDRTVCARWCLVGRHVGAFMGIPATGNEIAYRTCEVYELAGGQVVDTWVYGDPGGLFRQIGQGGPS